MQTNELDSPVRDEAPAVPTRGDDRFISLRYNRINIVGMNFDFLPNSAIAGVIECWKHRAWRKYIAATNPYSVILCRRDPEMYAATANAALRLPDGVGITLAARLLGHGPHRRLTGPELTLALCSSGRAFGFRHFFYGGGPGIADKLADNLCRLYPHLSVAGTCCPPYRLLSEEEDQRMVEQINAARPDIVWVGLGAPKQEKWMASHLRRIEATAMIGVGAAFDFHSGNVKWAPRWVRRAGLEWAYRLSCEPGRMWRRNLNSPVFLSLAVRQLLRSLFGRSQALDGETVGEIQYCPAPAAAGRVGRHDEGREIRCIPR